MVSVFIYGAVAVLENKKPPFALSDIYPFFQFPALSLHRPLIEIAGKNTRFFHSRLFAPSTLMETAGKTLTTSTHETSPPN